MMYYGGAGGLGWIWMGFSMIAFWAVVITLVVWGREVFQPGRTDQTAPIRGARHPARALRQG